MTLYDSLYKTQLDARLWLVGRYPRFKKAPATARMPLAPGKVLIVLAGLLGDSVMCVPAIVEARRIWKNAHLTVLGKRHNHELLAACPLIDEFYECDADPFSLRKTVEIKKLQKWLDNENFDAALLLIGDQYAHLLAKAKIPVRVGVRGSALESYLTHVYDIRSPRLCAADERLNALRCLGYTVENPLPQLWVEDSAKTTAKEKLAASGLGAGEHYAVLHPFGSTPRQWWSVENVAPLANCIYRKHRLRLVLIGKKYDLNGVVVELPPAEEIDTAVVNTTGKLTLPELLAVIDDAKLVITTDSGPFHIAGALRKLIVGLFRARRPEHAEHYPTATAILGSDEICQTKCRWDYCRVNPCRQLSEISVEAVLREVDEQLK